jgi:hypothetical protein
MLNSGETYKCPDPACGAVVEIKQSPELQGNSGFICTCGSIMEKA